MKNLVIVESPAKAATIEKFLGADFKVLSSYGHIRDLKNKEMSVEIDQDFSPIYIVPDDKKELVKKLKAEAKKADIVWLASDEDREGEAIAWHLYEVLGLKPETTRRIVFHEITKPAILHAIENPREIDLNLVNAQQARRVLDRVVGFEISPILWRKIKPALSAGRVQSVALRLICERENEYKNFTPEQYFRITALFATQQGGILKSELRRRFATEEEARKFLEACISADFRIDNLTERELHRSPAPPFTTSTLQQEAGRRLGFSVSQTMRLAQKLYEDGKITYMRTDSTNLSELALRDIKEMVEGEYGAEYLQIRHYHTKSKGAQEAHEAIRPTYISKKMASANEQEQRLYELIRRRTLASQMSEAVLQKTTVDILPEFNVAYRDSEQLPADVMNEDTFKAEGEVVTFEGFMKAYDIDPDSKSGGRIPPVAKGEMVAPEDITATQRFTIPPARYSEASLVKKMEELGIGRPSTYAPTISTIQTREYIRRGESEGTPRSYDQLTLSNGEIQKETLTENTGSDKGKLVPTDIGMVVNEFLTDHFPAVLDFNFTARIEEKFDEIADGDLEWKDELSDFYSTFHPRVEEVAAMRLDHKVGERILGTDPATGKTVSAKIGKFGPMVQIGEFSEDEKPAFTSLPKDKSIQDITLEEALKLFELPRVVGEINGEVVKANNGRFGPYVQIGKLFVSIPKDMSPVSITIDEAAALIAAKQEQEANRLIKSFDENPDIEILNGRFGPYIAMKKKGMRKTANYKIPKTTDPSTLTFDEVLKLIEEQDAAPAKKPRARKKS